MSRSNRSQRLIRCPLTTQGLDRRRRPAVEPELSEIGAEHEPRVRPELGC